MAALWIKVKEAATYPEVMKVYKRAGGGQGTGQSGAGGTTPASGVKGFLNTVRYYVESASRGTGQALPSWIRIAPFATNTSWENAQVDVTSIPGVRKLRDNGKWSGWPN